MFKMPRPGPTDSPLQAVKWELDAARKDQLRVVQIRVDECALVGSPVTVMLTPERIRPMAARMAADGLVADLEAQERWREVIIHPEDWMGLLIEARHELTPGGIYGYKVVDRDG